LALTGSIALYNYQQGNVLNTRYIPYFLSILLVGIAVAVLGIVAFIRAVQKRRYEVPPPPLPPPPPPPPP
jgi:ABC-type enterochelin transport system permease subunit